MKFGRKLTEREPPGGLLMGRDPLCVPEEDAVGSACPGGNGGRLWGNLDARAWCDHNSGGTTHAVGAKPAQGWRVRVFDLLRHATNARGGHVAGECVPAPPCENVGA